jgi:hypothetical protein
VTDLRNTPDKRKEDRQKSEMGLAEILQLEGDDDALGSEDDQEDYAPDEHEEESSTAAIPDSPVDD